MKNLTSNIKQVVIETRMSQKSQKEYYVLILEFKNGYKHESFLNNEQLFILSTLAQPAGN